MNSLTRDYTTLHKGNDSAIWNQRMYWSRNLDYSPCLTRSINCPNKLQEASSELKQSRNNFISQMKSISEQEKSILASYITKFIDKNLPNKEIKSIRVMPSTDKEKLFKYFHNKSPDIDKMNLCDLSASKIPKLAAQAPVKCYKKDIKTKYQLKNLLNEKSLIWQMCRKANFQDSDKTKIRRLAKTPTKITEYSITRKFLQYTETNNIPKEEYIPALNYVKQNSVKETKIPITIYNFLATVHQLLINGLEQNLGIYQFFTFGNKSIIVPYSGNSFIFLDLCIFYYNDKEI